MKSTVGSLVSVFVLSLGLSACSSKAPAPEVAPPPAPLPMTVQEAVDSPYRTPENKQRDQYRHPVETLEFFGVKPEMTVVEIIPGRGWYTEILAPLVSSKGQYIAASPFMDASYSTPKWLGQHPEIAAKAKIIGYNESEGLQVAPAGTADMVLTFRNIHNWMAKGNEKEVFAAFFKALKPGGILGVTEHRAKPKSKRDSKGKFGYVLEKDVISLAKKAGFKLVAKSEINANSKDLKNYPDGVWTLPPTLKLKEKDREKYMAIGESDRMTLKFVKP